MNAWQMWCLVLLLMAGSGHARFIKLIDIPKKLTWHLLQWIPLFGGMIVTFIYATQWHELTWMHSIYGNGGLAILPAVVAGVGYLIGLHFIWRNL